MLACVFTGRNQIRKIITSNVVCVKLLLILFLRFASFLLMGCCAATIQLLFGVCVSFFSSSFLVVSFAIISLLNISFVGIPLVLQLIYINVNKMLLKLYHLQRNDGPYYRPIHATQHQMYRPPSQAVADSSIMGSIGNGFNSILNNLFG